MTSQVSEESGAGTLRAQMVKEITELAAENFKKGWNAARKECAEIARNPETWKKLAEKGGIANVTVAGKAIAAAIERLDLVETEE